MEWSALRFPAIAEYFDQNSQRKSVATQIPQYAVRALISYI